MADPKPASVQISIRLPPTLIEEAEKYGQGLPIPANRSQVIAAALREYLDKHKAQPPVAPVKAYRTRAEMNAARDAKK